MLSAVVCGLWCGVQGAESLVDHLTGYVFSQSRVDEKTNEHKAALPLLGEGPGVFIDQECGQIRGREECLLLALCRGIIDINPH